MTFNTVLKIRRLLGVVALLGGLLAPLGAAAESIYFTPRSLLATFFPKSDSVTFQRFPLPPALRERLTARLGYAPRRDSVLFYVARTGGHVDGYAFIDEELGQSEPITFGVQLSPDGIVLRTEVLI